jgi:transketolase
MNTTAVEEKSMPTLVPTIHAKAVELARHVLEMTTAAGSGHPSTALALVHVVVELMYRRMRYDVSDPWHAGNDRLVLSAGHAVPIIYAAYADLGGVVGRTRTEARKLTVADLASLRELSSVLDGHPNPAEGFPFFDAATGSLGQGLSVAAGLALAARARTIDKRIYCILGDGESREGQVWEAADFIIDQKLSNVCAIFSCNGHGQAGPVSPQQSADSIEDKMRAFGWAAVQIDGHDPEQLASALDEAEAGEVPFAVVARTIKGWGVESIQTKNYHGKPLSAQELKNALAELDAAASRLDAEADETLPGPGPVTAHSGAPRATGSIRLPSFPEGCEKAGVTAALQKKRLATRVAYGAALAALGDVDDRVVCLDGDVSNSTFAEMFARRHPDRFFECKIAEQNMISAAAGLAAAGLIPFASSFGKFLARAADQIDMAAITRANLKIVGSHSGVSLAADGPSQMAVSDLAYFRSLTRVGDGRGADVCHVFHPSDAISAYRCVELMANIDGMCFMRTHRPDAPFLYPFDEAFPLHGCKQLRHGDRLTLVSSGYMLHTVLRAATQLEAKGITCNVFDAYTFPLDGSAILDAARAAGGSILTIEDNYSGGLHAELAEAAAEHGDIRVVGMTARRIPKSAKTADELFTLVGVGVEHIIQQAEALAS